MFIVYVGLVLWIQPQLVSNPAVNETDCNGFASEYNMMLHSQIEKPDLDTLQDSCTPTTEYLQKVIAALGERVSKLQAHVDCPGVAERMLEEREHLAELQRILKGRPLCSHSQVR